MEMQKSKAVRNYLLRAMIGNSPHFPNSGIYTVSDAARLCGVRHFRGTCLLHQAALLYASAGAKQRFIPSTSAIAHGV
jgi:hypothetical protein